MIFSGKYSIDQMRKIYDNASKKFDPKAIPAKSKDPDSQVFQSKFFLKFMGMAYKAFQNSVNGKNKNYFKMIENTNGDYGRRPGKIRQGIQSHIDWITKEIKKNKDVQYTYLRTFCDIYKILNDSSWKAAFKNSFEYCKKNGDSRTIACAFKVCYFALVSALEIILFKVIETEMRSADGENIIDVCVSIAQNNLELMDKCVVPAINLSVLMMATREPDKLIRGLLNSEDRSKRGVESICPEQSEEGLKAIAYAFKNTRKMSSAVMLGGFTAIIAIVAGVGGIALLPLILAAASIWIVVCFIPLVRSMVYYASIYKVDLYKELKLNEEMLGNNINALKEKMERTSSATERDRLKAVIEKQEAFLDQMVQQINEVGAELGVVENIMDRDEDEAHEEADEAGYDYGEDDNSGEEQSESSDDDYTINI